MENEQIIYKDYVNIGIAVDTERGLVVPSLRHADHCPSPKSPERWPNIAENVRNNNFTIEDLRGSTFTISNLGAIGGTYSTPIINPPEVAILLVGRSRKMPVVVERRDRDPADDAAEPLVRPSPGGRCRRRPLPERRDRLPRDAQPPADRAVMCGTGRVPPCGGVA